MKRYENGELLLSEGDPATSFYLVCAGRAKVSKMTPAGNDVILEIFGVGHPLGAVAVYQWRPFPASAMALEDTTCVLIPKQSFFALVERHPPLVRGLLLGLTRRLVELTNRIAELTGARRRRRAHAAVEAGAGRHDGDDPGDVHPDHEPLEQGRDRPDGVRRASVDTSELEALALV